MSLPSAALIAAAETAISPLGSGWRLSSPFEKSQQETKAAACEALPDPATVVVGPGAGALDL